MQTFNLSQPRPVAHLSRLWYFTNELMITS